MLFNAVDVTDKNLLSQSFLKRPNLNNPAWCRENELMLLENWEPDA